MADMLITTKGRVSIGEYEPGNGTRYTAIAVPWRFAVPMGAMGYVDEGWMVVYGNTGRAYLLRESGYLLDEYLAQHLGGLPGDYPFVGDLIRAMVGRPGGNGTRDEKRTP